MEDANRTSDEVVKEDKGTRQTTVTSIGSSKDGHHNEYAITL
jgi:hypothetical protein